MRRRIARFRSRCNCPDYYLTVFRIPHEASIDVTQTGLGLTQGLAAGLFIGLFIVVTTAWYNSRIAQRDRIVASKS